MLIYWAQIRDLLNTPNMSAVSLTRTVKHYGLFILLMIVFSKTEWHEQVHLKRPRLSRNICKLWSLTAWHLKMLLKFPLFSFDLKCFTLILLESQWLLIDKFCCPHKIIVSIIRIMFVRFYIICFARHISNLFSIYNVRIFFMFWKWSTSDKHFKWYY